MNIGIRTESFNDLSVAIVEFDRDADVFSSCVYNGGHIITRTLAIIEVKRDYFGNPKKDSEGLIKELGLPENTVIFMTAAEVDKVISRCEKSIEDDVSTVIATAGMGNQTVAGDTIDNWNERNRISIERHDAMIKHAGTINVIGIVNRTLTDSAKANAIIAMTEAKSAALHDLGWKETGTTSDAVAIVSEIGYEPVDYCGTGLGIGLTLAQAVRVCVRQCLIKRGDFPYDMPKDEIEDLRRRFQ